MSQQIDTSRIKCSCLSGCTTTTTTRTRLTEALSIYSASVPLQHGIGRRPPDCAAPPSACRRRLRRLGLVGWRAPPLLFRGRGGECLNRWPRHSDGAFLTRQEETHRCLSALAGVRPSFDAQKLRGPMGIWNARGAHVRAPTPVPPKRFWKLGLIESATMSAA